LAAWLFGCRKGYQNPEPAWWNPYEKVPLGQTPIRLSRVGLGTGMRAFNRMSNQTRLGQERFTELVRTCLERGISWFDAADLYGSHTFLAEALRGIPRSRYVLVSKVWLRTRGLPESQPEDIESTVHRFCRELDTDYIDLLLLHCLVEPDWPDRYEKQMETLRRLKQQGLLRAHGVSCHSLPALQAAASHPWVDSIHARINPFGVQMDGTPDQVVPILRQAHQNGKGLIGMKLIGEGAFRNSPEKRAETVDFVFNLGCIDAVTVGFESLDEEADFAQIVRRTPIRLEPRSFHT
jgi:aryl-alcohol dehydrogenase-like predicted oxidoreductase